MATKLVVLGIPWDVDTPELRQYMGKFGELDDCLVMKERSSGRSRGFGYVTFVSADDAKDQASKGHRGIGFITFDSAGGMFGIPRGMGRKIFVGRLPQGASADDLRQYFGRFGRILDAYVPKDPKRTGHKGFGFVTFADDGVADRVSRRSHEILGQEVAIDSATPVDDVGGSTDFANSAAA